MVSTVLRCVSTTGWVTSPRIRCSGRSTARPWWRSPAPALLMQATHPVAFAGFFANTTSLAEPYERLARTARVMDTIAYGTKAGADRATRHVREMHARVRGVTQEPAGRFPAGTPYAADDPELLLWILACLVDSAIVVYQKYVRSLTAAERDAYWQDYRVIGQLFGLRDAEMPAAIEEFEGYVARMLAGD